MSSISRRGAAIAVTMLVLGIASGSPAAATACQGSGAIDDRGGEAVGRCPGDSSDGGGASQPIGGGGGTACTEERAADREAWWISFDVPDALIPGGDGGGAGQGAALRPPEGQTLAVRRDCNGELRSGLLWVPEPVAGGAGDDAGIFVAREQARARVEPATPAFRVSPEQAVVRFPTWLWLEPDYWQPTSASSTTPGGLTVSVEARPVQVTWDLDEGVRVCDGPGIAWSQPAHAAYEAQPETVRGAGNPACTFTFVNSSTVRPTGVYEASVRVAWEFSWSLDGVGRGVFGSVEVSETWPLRVGEIQTVIIG